jgi:hypothetical protein
MTSVATPPHPTSTLLDWWLSVRSVIPAYRNRCTEASTPWCC